MPEWQVWFGLGAMLAAGWVAGVGLFLDRFAIGAAAACLAALITYASLDQQLQVFLAASWIALAAPRIARSLKKAARAPSGAPTRRGAPLADSTGDRF